MDVDVSELPRAELLGGSYESVSFDDQTGSAEPG
ncbi:hypothetical protein BW21_6141 (plasmid) [Burkholderia humptydooensis]|nr:hypothetical protein BW21_6141 [Burkholderia sp. 2002721687]